MSDFSINEMLSMQKELQEKYKNMEVTQHSIAL